MSDGTAALRFLDPATLTETGRVTVTDRNQPVTRLNELEFVKGEVYANVWGTDSIVSIAPETGHVTGWIDLAGILPAADRTPGADVLNGIAYDAAGDRLFVTGKQWPKLFEVRLIRRGS
jgi:glutamine cyclotransferase